MTDRMSNERIAELKAMEPGTPGPWRMMTRYSFITHRDSAQVVWDVPNSAGLSLVADCAGLTGADQADARLIAAAPEAFNALRQTSADLAQAKAALAERDAEIARLREALRFYANQDVYKPHPNGPAFDDRDLSFFARAALKETEHD